MRYRRNTISPHRLEKLSILLQQSRLFGILNIRRRITVRKCHRSQALVKMGAPDAVERLEREFRDNR